MPCIFYITKLVIGHGDALLVHGDEVCSAALVRDWRQVREINVHLDELLTGLPLATVDALTGVMKHFIIDVDQIARLDVVTDKA